MSDRPTGEDRDKKIEQEVRGAFCPQCTQNKNYCERHPCERVEAYIEGSQSKAKYYETVIIPDRIKQALNEREEQVETEICNAAKHAERELIEEIECLWSATNYYSPEAGRKPVNSIDVNEWQRLKQKRGV